ncbi:MAG: hypothetical protein Q8K78_07285 [Planctomycetaceae bacterium]|nr:hypothetical protein [Planctomycetaceae bacterium]
MTNATWPLSRWQDDCIEAEEDAIFIGPLARRFSKASRDLFRNASTASVGMIPGYESIVWQKMPASVMVLGCGAAAVSTQVMVVPASADQPTSLSDLITRLTAAYAVQLEIPREQHQRCSLGPGDQDGLPAWLVRCIATVSNALPGSEAERTAVAAGLHLLYDDLDGSHALSQTIEGRGKNRNGDYWHAIMHRREPDYGNSQYWFRRVGPHPVFAELPAVLDRVRQEFPSAMLEEWVPRLVSNGRWDPMAFVDASEAAANHPGETAFRQALEEIQHFEILHLLVQTCADAGA